MPKVLVLYYSSYGHIEMMAHAQAEGAARIPQARVVVKRVPETMPPEVAKASGCKLDQAAPLATPDELDRYDAIIFGTPTRFGNMHCNYSAICSRCTSCPGNTGPGWKQQR